jgi:hypothetical protein
MFHKAIVEQFGTEQLEDRRKVRQRPETAAISKDDPSRLSEPESKRQKALGALISCQATPRDLGMETLL